MKTLTFVILVLFFSCNSKKVIQEALQTDKIDPDIVLINIGDRDRSGIATLLQDIEKCSPSIVGIDILFVGRTENDSNLIKALKRVKNDYIAYQLEPRGSEEKSSLFVEFAKGKGYADLETYDNVTSRFTPIREIDGKVHESFAMKIVKDWRPGFKHTLSANESVPILFQRRQQQYRYFTGVDLHDKNVCGLIKDKIVLVGILGPGDEAKHISPIRSKEETQTGEPDMYGLVIQANAIRTILKYEKKE